MSIDKAIKVFLLLQGALLLAAVGCLVRLGTVAQTAGHWGTVCVVALGLLTANGAIFALFLLKRAVPRLTGHPLETAPNERSPASAVASPAAERNGTSPQTSPAQVASPSKGKAVAADPGYGHTVLVTDDNEINREILRELLEQVGLLVVEASNGQEAVDIVREWDITLAIMDVEMPVMDGLEATRRIRGMGYTPRDMPVLGMTGHDDTASRMDGMSLGMNDYLTKPVDPGTLYGALDKWLPGGLAPDQRDPGVPAGVRHVPGAHGSDAIDMEAGLAAIGGNQRLYQSLLSRFAVHYGSGLFQLREMLERGDFPGASRLAHTIKGVAANLGMRRVTELTKTMETSLPEVPPDESLLAEYETAMREALDCIAGLGISVRRIAVGTRELSEGCRRELLAFLGTLARRVETDWGTVQRELESYMATVDQTPYAEQMEQLMASVNDFDIIGIGRHLAPLCRHLEAAA